MPQARAVVSSQSSVVSHQSLVVSKPWPQIFTDEGMAHLFAEDANDGGATRDFLDAPRQIASPAGYPPQQAKKWACRGPRPTRGFWMTSFMLVSHGRLNSLRKKSKPGRVLTSAAKAAA
jgi:hypothetical protein